MLLLVVRVVYSGHVTAGGSQRLLLL